MSFSSGVKEELYRHISPARHCQLAELAALLHFNGSIGVGTTGTFLQIHAENALVVRKCFTLLQKTFNISTETRVQQGNQQTGYFCRIDEPELIRRILQGIKFLDQTGSPTSGEENLQDGLRCPVSRLLIRNSGSFFYVNHIILFPLYNPPFDLELGQNLQNLLCLQRSAAYNFQMISFPGITHRTGCQKRAS